MNPGSPEWLLASWARTTRPTTSVLEGHPVGRGPVGRGRPAAFAAVDSVGRPHLLVEVPPDAVVPRLRQVRALRIAVEQLSVGTSAPRAYLDLQCTHAAHDATFAALVAEVIRALDDDGGSDPCPTVVGTIERWRSFWSVDPAGLGADQALGLFGELWFLDRWMAPVTRSVIEAWSGPEMARHDVQWPLFSIEVKASATQSLGGVAHRIASLDQLEDPVEGQLLLFSLHVADDALARNTLPAMVERVRASTLSDLAVMELLDGKLASRGYSPAHAARYHRPVRVVSEGLYAVGPNFPRLTDRSFPTGIPAGITHVTYTLAIVACSSYLVATSPADGVWQGMRATVA